MSDFLTELQVTVMKKTAAALDEMGNRGGMSVGEVIDRLTVQFRPKDPELALHLAETEVLMLTTELDKSETEKYLKQLVIDLCAMVTENEDEGLELVKAAMETRKTAIEMLNQLSTENKLKLKMALKNGFDMR